MPTQFKLYERIIAQSKQDEAGTWIVEFPLNSGAPSIVLKADCEWSADRVVDLVRGMYGRGERDLRDKLKSLLEIPR